ncbi:hypothetical protein IJT93_04915 [bacterium]|nr:hypothetical protein [bacterium]
MQKYIKYIALIIVCLFAAGTLLAPAQAAKKKEKKENEHPLAVLRAEIDREAFKGQEIGVRRQCTIWLKNLSHKELKDVKVNLKVLYQAKVIHDLDKTVESLDASERVFVTFKWQDYEMKPKYTHQIWLTYTNDDGEEVTYECEPPVW